MEFTYSRIHSILSSEHPIILIGLTLNLYPRFLPPGKIHPIGNIIIVGSNAYLLNAFAGIRGKLADIFL